MYHICVSEAQTDIVSVLMREGGEGDRLKGACWLGLSFGG